MVVSMVTTSDNPFSPFDQYDDWYGFDTRMGYNTASYLARIAKTSPDLSPALYTEAIEDAIDEILYYNLTGNYVRVTKEYPQGGFVNIDPPMHRHDT